jgi:hypothetical protein
MAIDDLIDFRTFLTAIAEPFPANRRKAFWQG